MIYPYEFDSATVIADIKQKSNDNYLVLFNSFGNSQSKIILAETTPVGDTIWTHEFFGYGSAIANHLDLYPDESILISGESNGDAYIIKTDSSGYAPRIGIAGINQFYCQGDTAELSVHGGVSYLWSNGATDSTIQLTTSQSVWAMITDSSGHSFHSDNYHLVFHAPAIDLGPDTTICINDTLQLSAGSNYLAWQWQDMSTLNSYNAFSSVPDTQLIYVQVTDSNSCIGSDSITVVFDVCNGIAQANESSFVSVFPNPAADKFSILNSSTERIRFSIYSIEGKIVYENQVEAGKTIVLETKNFPSGIYLIRTLTEDGMISVQKLLIGD
ncbi:MAG: T9SS type A sorting domain-containing protein [Bacteroidia bacterium]